MSRIALYPGSFDPLTNGHMDILRHALMLADQIEVAIGVHAGKKPMFTAGERKEMLVSAVQSLGAEERIHISYFDGLVVDAARNIGANLLIRGLRDGTDLDYEMQMAGMNKTMMPEILTIFIPASSTVRHITATLVRQIASMGGDVTEFVPQNVNKTLSQKFSYSVSS